MAAKATDVVAICLDINPVSALQTSFVVLKLIWEGVQVLQSLKQQLTCLTEALAHVLQCLDSEYRAQRLMESRSAKELGALQTLLYDISDFVKTQNSYGLLKIIYQHNESMHAVKHFHRQLITVGQSFNATVPQRISNWQSRLEEARKQDQESLDKRLTSLEGNRRQLADTLISQHTTVLTMMVSLQKSLDRQAISVNARHRRFLRHSLTVLETTSPEQDSIPLEDWFITSLEVEYGESIALGDFCQVFKATWDKSLVAVKVFKTKEGLTPSSTCVRREIEAWTNLNHPNVLRIFGGNVFDTPPFIVTPLLQNGNALDYIRRHPSCDRVKILYHVAQGLMHLHSHGVVHGDLKGLNVLIDNAGIGVVCDFGLSRIKVDAKSKGVEQPDPIMILGSWHWMSPERLTGGMLKKPVDIYAFGMTIWELLTCKVPLGHLSSHSELCELVVNQEVRPERPAPDIAPGLSDYLWNIATKCWRSDPKGRPEAARLSDEMDLCYHAEAPRTPEGRQAKRGSEPIQEHLDPPPPFEEEPPGPIPAKARQKSAATELKRVRDVEAISLSSRKTEKSRLSTGSTPSEILESPAIPFPTRENKSYVRLTPLRPAWAYDPSRSSLAGSKVLLASEPSSNSTPGSSNTQLPIQLKVLVDYIPSYPDAMELTIKKGEMLEMLDDKGKWWMCRKADGSRGIVLKSQVSVIQKPAVSRSNSLLRLRSPSKWSLGFKRKGSLSGSSHEIPTPFPIPQQSPTLTSTLPASPSVSYPNTSDSKSRFNATSISIFQARAKHTYKSQTPGELSFLRGDVLDVLDIEMRWWVARNADGAVGIIPYNFVQVIR